MQMSLTHLRLQVESLLSTDVHVMLTAGLVIMPTLRPLFVTTTSGVKLQVMSLWDQGDIFVTLVRTIRNLD